MEVIVTTGSVFVSLSLMMTVATLGETIFAPGAVSNWLYGVAHTTALKAQAMIRKRRTREREAGMLPSLEEIDILIGIVDELIR